MGSRTKAFGFSVRGLGCKILGFGFGAEVQVMGFSDEVLVFIAEGCVYLFEAKFVGFRVQGSVCKVYLLGLSCFKGKIRWVMLEFRVGGNEH